MTFTPRTEPYSSGLLTDSSLMSDDVRQVIQLGMVQYLVKHDLVRLKSQDDTLGSDLPSRDHREQSGICADVYEGRASINT